MLSDCVNPVGEGSRELFVVEGISAADAVLVARDPASQAVLAVQGKPMNVERASARDIVENEKLSSIVRAVGAWSGEAFDLDSVRYDRVLILTDGDADGVHASALLLLAFDYLMPELLKAGRLERVRAPLFAINAHELSDPIYAHSPPHLKRLVAKMADAGYSGVDHDYLKSVAGLNADELWRVCLDPETRVAQALSRSDAEVARQTLANFGTVS